MDYNQGHHFHFQYRLKTNENPLYEAGSLVVALVADAELTGERAQQGDPELDAGLSAQVGELSRPGIGKPIPVRAGGAGR